MASGISESIHLVCLVVVFVRVHVHVELDAVRCLLLVVRYSNRVENWVLEELLGRWSQVGVDLEHVF